MSLIKLGEASVVTMADLQSADSVLADPDILGRFQKVAAELKSIAPKAKDFLYFSAIMMHAAEAALLNTDGTIKKDAEGKELTSHWTKKGESWRWQCSDIALKPYKNSNNDIFPEEELIKAHKKWIGRPLCLDHKSSSVDMIRGVIVDTYYDRPNKRVVALCALDKLNYPDLARKVETGYAASVSMGTAVGKAICSDCGNVARVESDFCDCMRLKKCYGEINVDLNPIELSIVVNGADPKAKIRHIVAAADSLAQYVELKEKEFSKLAVDETGDIQKAKDIEQGLDKAIKDLEALKMEVKQLGEHEMQEMQEEAAGKADLTKAAALKSASSLLPEIEEMNKRFEQITEKINKLSEDNKMTNKKAYFQGGGGPNEPTPGKPKYEKEDEDSIRSGDDKQMGGQMDTGPVDGMHPGYDSFGETEEARKKRLQRLASEQEARQLRRQAALEKVKETISGRKEAYFQGTEEPTPGKPKYQKEDAEKIRDKEDKQMVGQPPFPGVGAIDGLHPSPASADVKDELKRKEMLARASKLNGKFIVAANADGVENKGESRWQVYADKKLVLTATVNEITGGRVDALYDSVATAKFGESLLAKIRAEGLDKVSGLLKSAQAPSPGPTAAPAPSGAPDMGPPMGDEPVVDKGGNGDPKDQLPELLDKADETLANVRKGVEVLMGQSSNELDSFEQMGGEGAPVTAANKAVGMQKKLSKALLIGMKEATVELSEHINELKMAQYVCNSNKVKESDTAYVNELVKDACDDAKTTIADCYRLMEAFVKYARGTELLVKVAQTQPATFSPSGLAGDPLDPTLPGDAGSTYKAPAPKPAPKAAPKPAPKKPGPNDLPVPYGDRSGLETMMTNVVREGPLGGQFQAPKGPRSTVPRDVTNYSGNADDGDVNNVLEMKPDGTMTAETPADAKAMMDAKKAAEKVDLTTKEGRAEYRAKLAQKGLTFSDMLGKAHPKGGFTTQLDTKPTGDLAKVEDLEEVHSAIMDVATAPVKVRKEAEAIQKMVLAGRINPATDFPGLIAQGVDKDAVAYWKSLYGEVGKEGSQFASELVKEHVAQKMAEEKEAYQVKVARAYEVAYDMVRRGMIGDDRHALNQQVNELMKFNDAGFDSMKRWVEKQPFAKTASIPQVGLIGSGEITLPAPEAAASDLVADLERAFSNRKY
ncbi:MAG TPA: hypothetical protein VM577_14185 [Anaerovoracaceae bacterium]|nr:hypothetical protein [Anaerovoracaceae bacterium]